MIYRILADSKIPHVDPVTGHYSSRPGGRLAGGFIAGLDGFSMKYPDLGNARLRFWFTERGWKQVGQAIVAQARQEGHVVRVLRRKNPLRSAVAYKDELQVALLPKVKTKGRSAARRG